MRKIKNLIKSESGIAVEYILIIAVVVAGVIAAAYYFIPEFQSGSQKMGENIKDRLTESHTTK